MAQRPRPSLPFELGRLDIAQGLLAPAGLHGRAPELAALTAAVERVRGGACELLVARPARRASASPRLVAGAARRRREPRALFVAGKSDPLQANLPYAALTEPLRAFLRGSCCASQRRVIEPVARASGARRWAPTPGVVGDLIPELRVLLGEMLRRRRRSARWPARTAVRLTLQALVQALAGQQRPLVLVLDDVQWADAASLAVLERLATHRAPATCWCWRCPAATSVGGPGPAPRLVQAARDAGATAAALTLRPLDLAALAALCAEALRCPPSGSARWRSWRCARPPATRSSPSAFSGSCSARRC